MASNTELGLKLFVVLNRALAAIEKHAEADIRRHGLSMTEFGALEALFQKGDLLVGELQRSVLKSSGGITYVVDRLQEKGLVARKPCPGDRRAVYASITAEGRTLMERIFPVHASVLTAAMGSLTREEKRQAIDLLRALGRGAADVRHPRAASSAETSDPEEDLGSHLETTKGEPATSHANDMAAAGQTVQGSDSSEIIAEPRTCPAGWSSIW